MENLSYRVGCDLDHQPPGVRRLRSLANLPASLLQEFERLFRLPRFSKALDLEYKFQKQTGGRGKFAVICVRYKPLRPEDVEAKVKEIEELKDPKIKPDPNNVYFVNAITQGSISKEYIPSVEEGLALV